MRKTLVVLGLVAFLGAEASWAALEPSTIINAKVESAGWHWMGQGTLFVYGVNGSDIVLAEGTNDGRSWRVQRIGRPSTYVIGSRIAASANALADVVLGATIHIKQGRATRMPIWYLSGGQWTEAVLGALDGRPTARTVTSIVRADKIGQLLYAGGSQASAKGTEARVWRSVDGGREWKPIYQPRACEAARVYGMIDADTLIGGSQCGLFTIDAQTGKIDHIFNPTDHAVAYDVSVASDGSIFYSWLSDHSYRVSYSGNGGRTWGSVWDSWNSPPKLSAHSLTHVLGLGVQSSMVLYTNDHYKAVQDIDLGPYRLIDIEMASAEKAYVLAERSGASELVWLTWSPIELEVDGTIVPGNPNIAGTLPPGPVVEGAGPMVVLPQGLPPRLEWLGTRAYKDCGVNPKSGDATTIFRFRVVYKQAGGVGPQGMHLRVQGQTRRIPMKASSQLGNGFADGVAYLATVQGKTIGGTGEYWYWFEVGDGTQPVEGPASGRGSTQTVRIR